MAHYAEIDENNKVIRVLVVDDSKTAEWLSEVFGGTWIQTSYTGSIRKNYAGVGYEYNAEIDAFILPQPYESWILNSETAEWEAPIPYPTDGNEYKWDKEKTDWTVAE